MTLESTQQFFEIAGRQGLLSAEALRDLKQEANRTQVEGSLLAIQKGLLSPLDVEIIETLRLPNEAVPGYEIQSVIGHGGMGVVYRAKQRNLDRVVALKTIHVNQAANPTVLARFEQEAQTVARLVHPHIISAFDFGRYAGRLFFAMEYVEGEDAEQYVRREYPLSERQVWFLIRQAASGLSYAAEFGIVHRDIKPANLLLVEPPRGFPLPPGVPLVKIADFGLAFLSTDAGERIRLTSEQSPLGSPHYMAPEQFDAAKPTDSRADIYSLGATAFDLLTGRPPFDGLTLPQIIAGKLSNEFPSVRERRPDVSAETASLIDQMTQRDPERRISDYGDLIAHIDSLPAMRNDGTTTSFGMSTMPDIVAVNPRPGNHRPVMKLVLAGLAALMAVAIVVAANSWVRTPHEEADTAFIPTGWTANLFDGQTLRGWKVQSGAWTADTDDEGGTVLAGTNGEIARPLLKIVDRQVSFLPHYRVTTIARLHAANAIELHFNVTDSGRRDVVRLTLDRVALGDRADMKADFRPVADAKAVEIGVTRQHRIRVERGSVWRVFVDDIEIGTRPLSKTADLPEFRLVVEGGPAWFGNVIVEELAEQEPNAADANSR